MGLSHRIFEPFNDVGAVSESLARNGPGPAFAGTTQIIRPLTPQVPRSGEENLTTASNNMSPYREEVNDFGEMDEDFPSGSPASPDDQGDQANGTNAADDQLAQELQENSINRAMAELITQMSNNLGAVQANPSDETDEHERLRREHQELKQDFRDLKQECKDLKQEAKEAKQELKEENAALKSELRRCTEERRLLQTRMLVVQNEILLLQGDLRFVLRNPDKLLPPRPGQGLDRSSVESSPAMTTTASVAGKRVTPQAQIMTMGGAADPDTTPTPSKAVLARMSGASPSSSALISDDAIARAGTGSNNNTLSSTFGSHAILKKPSTHFINGTPPSGGYAHHQHGASPLVARGSNPQPLRERASFYNSNDQPGSNMGRFAAPPDDPFQSPSSSSSFHGALSRPSSMLSLTSSHPATASSTENLRATPSSSSSSSRGSRRSSSKALASSNWRAPRPRASLPEVRDLDDARAAVAGVLARVERWADLYCGTIHTSVRSKELRTVELLRALGGLVGEFDLERVFTSMELRTLLVAGWVNRRVWGRLMGDAVLEWVGGTALARVRELAALESGAPARDPAVLGGIVKERAEILRGVFGDEALVPEWRKAEADALVREVCGLLEPIIPTTERNAGREEMGALVEEAFGVVGALRGMLAPARSWGLAFDAAGARVALASMSVRASVGGRVGGGEAAVAGGLEEEHVVVLGITPHLVSKVWTPAGVVPEELLKAEVLTHPAGRGFFGQHR